MEKVKKVYRKTMKILQICKSYDLEKIIWAENVEPKEPKAEK